MEQSETVRAAVPTAADSFTTVGTIRGPAAMTRIKGIDIGYSPDQTLADTSVQIVPVIRLGGSGLQEQSPHDYLGPCGGEANKTDMGGSAAKLNCHYDVDIPIGIGGDINIQCDSVNEVTAAGTVTVGLIFDDTPPSGKNNMSDYVAAVAGAAGAWTAVGTLIVPVGEGTKAPSRIKKLIIGVGLDQGAAAFTLRHATVVRLSGSGLKGGGIHEYVGPCGDTGIVVTGGYVMEKTNIELDVDLPVSAAGEIDVEQLFTTETPTDGTIIIGVMYE